MRGTRFVRYAAPFAAVAMLSGTFSKSARADATSDLDAAATAYAELDYDKAYKLADSVSKQHALSHDQLVRDYRILARSAAVLGKDAIASEAFKLLLEYNPDEKMDASQPPKIQDAFGSARGFWAGFTIRPGIEMSSNVHAREAGSLHVTTRDPLHVVKRVAVGYRWGAAGSFTTAYVATGEGVTVDVPAGPANISRFDYYALALDDRDDAVFEFGSAGLPKTQVVDVPPVGGPGPATGGGGGRSIFASPVFWIITGAVLAGGATGVFFATRGKKDETLPPTSAALSPSLVCGGAKCQ